MHQYYEILLEHQLSESGHVKNAFKLMWPVSIDFGCSDFLKSNYAEMKKANPAFSILVREATGAEAKLIARYGKGEHFMVHNVISTNFSSAWIACSSLRSHMHCTGFGVEKSVSVQGDKPEVILNKLESLIKAGESLPK